MNITLRPRTEENVRIYFEKTRYAAIQRFLPMKAQSVGEAVEDFRKSTSPGSSSFGKSIYADGAYIGDVWCYCIQSDEPNAMLSYCIFEKSLWGHGAATKAVELFTAELKSGSGIKSIGALTFAENLASIRVLEKNGFSVAERFTESGVESAYMEKELS